MLPCPKMSTKLLSEMKTRLILKAGQRGTKRLMQKYGDELVCPFSVRTNKVVAKAAGGTEKQLWYVRYGNILGTLLEKHIHVDTK